MANLVKGEVSFDVGGEEFTLCFSASAICNLEDSLGIGIVSIFNQMESWKKDPTKITLTFFREIFYAALKDRHPDITKEKAGDLIIASGGIVNAMGLILESVTRAFPKAETKGTRPRKKIGSGRSS